MPESRQTRRLAIRGHACCHHLQMLDRCDRKRVAPLLEQVFLFRSNSFCSATLLGAVLPIGRILAAPCDISCHGTSVSMALRACAKSRNGMLMSGLNPLSVVCIAPRGNRSHGDKGRRTALPPHPSDRSFANGLVEEHNMPLSQPRMLHSPLHALRRCAVAACLTVFWVGAAVAQPVPVPESFADLAQAKLPSVVTITATRPTRMSPDQTPRTRVRSAARSPGVRFPARLALQGVLQAVRSRRDRAGGSRPPATALGSGFIIDPTGYIVTNNHVVSGC